MSLGLFPSAVTVFSPKNDNKTNTAVVCGAAALGALTANSSTSSVCPQPSQPNDHSTLGFVPEGGVSAAHRQQRSHHRPAGISPFQHHQQPYISGTGGAKRKLSNSGIAVAAMQPHHSDQTSGSPTPTSSDDDEFRLGAFGQDAEPRAKQRRYEERMSTKLSGIRLRDEHGKVVKTTQRTTDGWDMLLGDALKQRKGPLIEEISGDWTQVTGDAELLPEDESMLQNAANAPIVEEPDDGNSNLWSGRGKQPGDKKLEANRRAGRPLTDNDGKYGDDEANLDNGWYLPADSESMELRELQQQRVELSPELHNLISSLHYRNGGGGDNLLTTIGRTVLTGKELIPFVPPPSAAFLPSLSSFCSSSASLEENRNLFPAGEDDELLRLAPPRVEEVLDDEILPDAAVGTPQVQSDNDDDWPPTPPSLGTAKHQKGQDAKLPAEDDGQEDAMEMD